MQDAGERGTNAGDHGLALTCWSLVSHIQADTQTCGTQKVTHRHCAVQVVTGGLPHRDKPQPCSPSSPPPGGAGTPDLLTFPHHFWTCRPGQGGSERQTRDPRPPTPQRSGLGAGLHNPKHSPLEEREGRPCWAPAFSHGSSPNRGARTRGPHGQRRSRFSYTWPEASGVLRAETGFGWGPPAIPPPRPGPRPHARATPPGPPCWDSTPPPPPVPDAPLTPPAPGTARFRGYSRGRRARRPPSGSRAPRATRAEGRGRWSPW